MSLSPSQPAATAIQWPQIAADYELKGDDPLQQLADIVCGAVQTAEKEGSLVNWMGAQEVGSYECMLDCVASGVVAWLQGCRASTTPSPGIVLLPPSLPLSCSLCAPPTPQAGSKTDHAQAMAYFMRTVIPSLQPTPGSRAPQLVAALHPPVPLLGNHNMMVVWKLVSGEPKDCIRNDQSHEHCMHASGLLFLTAKLPSCTYSRQPPPRRARGSASSGAARSGRRV